MKGAQKQLPSGIAPQKGAEKGHLPAQIARAEGLWNGMTTAGEQHGTTIGPSDAQRAANAPDGENQCHVQLIADVSVQNGFHRRGGKQYGKRQENKPSHIHHPKASCPQKPCDMRG